MGHFFIWLKCQKRSDSGDNRATEIPSCKIQLFLNCYIENVNICLKTFKIISKLSKLNFENKQFYELRFVLRLSTVNYIAGSNEILGVGNRQLLCFSKA
jgi:hypothetical protein